MYSHLSIDIYKEADGKIITVTVLAVKAWRGYESTLNISIFNNLKDFSQVG